MRIPVSDISLNDDNDGGGGGGMCVRVCSIFATDLIAIEAFSLFLLRSSIKVVTYTYTYTRASGSDSRNVPNFWLQMSACVHV